MSTLKGKNILVTGGTGSFGQAFVETVLRDHDPAKLVVFSRDELKQGQMRERLRPLDGDGRLRYFIGDIRDKDRLYRAFDGIDVVIHAAALKQVPACEYNPIEAIRTNVLGSANVVDAAIDRNVEQVVALSTDKAANPVNLYGATKLCSDKLFVAGNNYSGHHSTRFSVVRYGNVLGSRGSVVPLFLERRKSGVLPITHPDMTRFWITLNDAVDFVLVSLDRMHGGEIFVPKIPSMKITDLARAVAPESELRVVGIRPGEKLHEVMIPDDDARSTVEHDDYYTILPLFHEWDADAFVLRNGGRWCEPGFKFSSDNNNRWITAEELREMIGLEFEIPVG